MKGGAAIAVDDARVNEQIRAREIRLISETGDQLGVRATPEALEIFMIGILQRCPGIPLGTGRLQVRDAAHEYALEWPEKHVARDI